MQTTEHYGLNLWNLSDQIRMEDFNRDNTKLDAALASLASGFGEIKLLSSSSRSSEASMINGWLIWGPSAPVEWDQWSIVIMIGGADEPTQGTLTCRLAPMNYTIPYVEYPFPPGGFMLILTPMKDGSKPLSGIYITKGNVQFIESETPFNNVTYFTINCQSPGYAGKMVCQGHRIIAIR